MYPNIDLVSFSKCSKCRMFEFECKKLCFDELKEMGYIKWGHDLPRTQSMGWH